jgi:hypothetical protein
LNQPQRRQLRWLLLGIIITGLMDVAGISSIFPFMAVVARPDSVQGNRILLFLYEGLGFGSQYRFLFALGLAVLGIMLVGNAMAALMSAMMLKFGHRVGSEMAIRMLASYLEKPYSFFLARNSATMTLNVVGETGGMVLGLIVPALQTLAKMIVAAFILLLLLAVDPVLAVIVAVAVGGSYFLVFLFVRRRDGGIGRDQGSQDPGPDYRLHEEFCQRVRRFRAVPGPERSHFDTAKIRDGKHRVRGDIADPAVPAFGSTRRQSGAAPHRALFSGRLSSDAGDTANIWWPCASALQPGVA